MKKGYIYIFLLFWIMIIFTSKGNFIIINGLPEKYSQSEVILYLPFIISIFYLVFAKYTYSLNEYGYLMVINSKSRIRWVKKIFVDSFFLVLEYSLILNIMNLIFCYTKMSFLSYVYSFILFTMVLYLLVIMQIFFEYLLNAVISLTIMLVLFLSNFNVLHIATAHGINLMGYKFFLPSLYLESNLRINYESEQYLYFIFIIMILGGVYLIFSEYFKRRDIL